MHGIDEGELEIEPYGLLRQFSTLLLQVPDEYSLHVFEEEVGMRLIMSYHIR